MAAVSPSLEPIKQIGFRGVSDVFDKLLEMLRLVCLFNSFLFKSPAYARRVCTTHEPHSCLRVSDVDTRSIGGAPPANTQQKRVCVCLKNVLEQRLPITISGNFNNGPACLPRAVPRTVHGVSPVCPSGTPH